MKKIIFGVFAVLGLIAVNAATYYTVGGDSSSDTSFTSSTAGLDYGGWSSEASATATEAHTVAAGNDYVIKDGDSLRSRSTADASWDTFKGDSLTIAGTFNLKDNDNATRTITVNNLIADGGTISVMKSNTAKLTLDGSMTVPEGKTIKFDLDGGKYDGGLISKYPYLRVASTVTGAGTVVLDLFGEVSANFNSGLPLVRFDFAGDWSGFTGDVVKGRESSSTITPPAKSSYVLMFTGSFGGRIASLSPKSADPYYVINYAANPKGIRAADFPNALRYRTVFYNLKSTDKNVKLFVYPKDKRPTFDLTYYDTDNAETALAKRAASPSQATAIAVSDITFVDSGDGLETAVWHYDASTYDEGEDDPGAGEPEELTMLSPADGATVALLTDRQKGWIALEPEDRVKVLVSDSSAPVAYKDVTSADFSNGSPVTFTWSGATGAVTLTVKKGDATVETVTTSAGSATVYNLEPGVTYTWTLTSGNVTTEAFTFTTEANPPRIIKAGTMSLLRDLCGWTGLQGCKIRANQVFRGAPPNVSSSPFESRLDAQGIDFWQNRVGLKTQIDFRNASEVAEAGTNGKLTFVDNYCNYNIEYYKAYAPSEVTSGAGKNFLDALRTILTSSKRPVYFHCKWGRDRTGTMASVILGVLGVSEDDIIDDYHLSPLYNGNQPREYFNNFVSFLTSIKTTYPADTLAKSVEKYFLAIGITKTEIETFRTEMLDGYETPEEPTPIDPGEDITPTGATFYEKLANDTRAVTSSDYATGGDYIYKVSDTEYIHVFKSSNTFTLNQDLANVQLLVVGGGGSGGGRYGGGGGAGGVVYQSGRALSAGSYTITVGAGGASVKEKNSGKNGGNSTFSGAGLETVTAIGGGGGGGYYSTGLNGGSGGGASGNVGTGKDGSDNVGGSGTAGQGYAGGISSTASGIEYPARGGGGGAGEPGGNADVGGRGNQPTNVPLIGGNGGNGLDYGTQMLGYRQYFGGGGGGSTTKDSADAVNYRGLGGLGGGGDGAYLRAYEATTPTEDDLQATAGEDGLGGGGGGGSVGWDHRKTETGAVGGKGIVIVRYSISPVEPTEPEEPEEPVEPDEPTAIEIPTGANLTYTGAEQTGVAAGEGYTLTGTSAATTAGNYTATATLKDLATTKWSDNTTSAKEINWSIAKATPVISGTLTMAGWTEGEAANEPSGLSTSFGTVEYKYYSDSACTTSIAKPTTAGTYYVRGEVADSANWNAVNSAAVEFTIEAPVSDELVIREGHFIEDLTSFASAHPASSPIATGGDLVYAVGDYEYHIFTKGGTLTLLESQTADILLVGGGGGAGWNGGGGGGGGAFVELSNQDLAIGAYAVTVGTGGAAAYADSKAWGQTGGTSSITGITGASAPGGKGGIGWNGKNGNPAATVGGQAGTAGNSAGGDGGNSGNKDDKSGADGSAGSKSMILGVEQGFAGGGGGGGHVNTQKAHAPSYGQDGGGNGAGSEGSKTLKYLATSGEDGLGGGGGGGASGTWAGEWPTDGTTENKSRLQNSGDGGDGIVIFCLKGSVESGKIAIPTAKENLVYTGDEQTGVEQGMFYTLTGNTGTNADTYTATATLDDTTTTKWTDGTTEPKTINWSIAKATPVISGTLTMAGWAEGEAANEPSGLSTDFGTVEYKYYSDSACTTPIEKPTTRGTYYVRGEVADSANWEAANSAVVSFTVSAPLGVLALTSPITTAANPIEILTADQKTWLYTFTKEQRYGLMANDTSLSPSDWNTKDIVLFSNGSPITLVWEGTEGRSSTVVLTRLSDNKQIFSKTVSGCSLTVYNLEIGAGYSWSVTCEDKTASAEFYTSPTAPRLLKTGTMRCMRDLGGWTGLQGRVIRQNEIIRGGPANDPDHVSDASYRYADDQAYDFFFNELGLKTEIDLRATSEIGGNNGKLDVQGTHGVAYKNFNIAESTFYLPSDKTAERQNFEEIFKTIFNAANRPVYFHCARGRDRTGTVAMMCEAILGVSEDDIWRDYQSSIFTPPTRSMGTVWTDMTTHYNKFNTFLENLKLTYSADTLAESAEKYLLSLGITKDEIETFRTEMLDGYETPEEPTPSDPEKIEIPTGANLTYNGQQQTGVAAGDGYTVENGVKTEAGNYTATATLKDPATTKWSDNTTSAKEINWSIAKATPVLSGTLTMAGWTEGGTASEPSGLSSQFGTVEYKYYADQACTEPIEKPTEVGTYYVRGEVAADTNWNAANSEAILFKITEALEYTTYYKVGSDSGSSSSFAKSDSSTSGWSLTQDGTIDTTHVVSADGDYIVPSGTELRTLPDPATGTEAVNTFLGHSLTLAGGKLSLKCKSGATGTSIMYKKTVNIADLTLTGGGTVAHSNDGTEFTLAGDTIMIPTDETGVFSLSGGNARNLIVKSAIRGAGTLQLSWQGAGSAPSQQNDTMKLMGDNSLFTGTLTAVGDTSVANTQYTLVLDGKFGGTITSLPKAKSNSLKVNYGNNPGLTVATTTIPAALKTDLLFYSGSTDFTAKNLPLMTFQEGTTVNVDDFTSVKYATGEAAPTTTKFTNLGTVVNMDGTITLVANAAAIQIPVGKTLEYTGTVQQGVDAGAGYTLSGTFSATELGSYTAIATLDAGEVWSDGTTAPKSIDWSIIKATNSWVVEPSLSKTTWPVNKSPAILMKGAPKFGTMTATLDGEPFDLDHPTFPTVEGDYTLVISVAASDRWTALEQAIEFLITEEVESQVYYMVGKDASGKTSFFESSNLDENIGWSDAEDGDVFNHTVAVGNDYVIPSDAALRTAPNDNADTFLGDSLKLAGEIRFKKSDSTGVGTAKTVTIPKLVADGGKLNNEMTNVNAFDLAGALEIPEGKSLTVLNQGAATDDRKRNFKISATATGSGTLYVSLGAGADRGALKDGTGSVLELSGDWSGFTGEVTATPGQTKLSSWTFIISGAFGGAIGAMPERYQDPSYIFNLANNPDGIRIAGTGDELPTCLRYRACFYGVDFANGKDINLLKVPKSVRAALTSELAFKWAGSYNDAVKGMQTGSPAPAKIDVSKISFVDNRDGTETYVYNRTTFYEKLANDTRKVDASDYATGGDYIYQVNNKEYIHVFKNSGTFTPNKDLTDVQVLVVGGGGAGGYASGGGGGAGGLVYQTDVSFTSGADYTVTVGAGGAKKTSSGSGNNGGASSIGDIVAAGGGGGAGKNSAGIAGGSGGGGSGGGRSGGAGTTVLGSAGGAGCAASNDAIGGGGGGAGEVGWVAGTLGPGQTSESVYNAGCGGNGREIGTAILGYAQYFAGGGGGGTAGGVKRYGIGGFGGGGVGGYDVNNVTFQTPGEDGLGGGGGGGAVDWGPTDGKDHNGAAGGKGVVIVRYMVPVDAKITGTITMSGWKEDETPSEPDLTGLTVTPDMAASALLVKYYADADCTQALDGKPILAGTYYVRAEIEKTRQYTAAVSEKTAFTIESGEKAVVPIPEVQSFVYDGTPKTCVEAGEGYAIDIASTVTATDAGDYSVTLKLVDPETSQWSDLTSADKVIPWSIAQAENEWTTAAAIDKTEWMQTLDETGKLTAPVAKFGPIVATLNGQDWNGTLPTEIGSYAAKWTVEETANYTGFEVTISFRIKPDFYTNAWKTEPTISKTSWKSTEEPATIIPAEAAYGNDTISAKISVDNGPLVDWDGKVPTTKGAYKIQWVVEETESYSRLEKTIEFLIDRRYCPTHPFMYQKAGDTTWKGADTFAAALNGITDGTGTIELCQDITDATVDKIGTLNYKSITLRSNPDDDQIYVWTRLGKSYNGFQVQNSSKLTIADIVLNITANGSGKMINLFELGSSANENGGEVTLGAGAVVQGEVSGSLYTTEKGSSFVLNGGTIRNLTAGSSLLPMPRKSFSVKSGTIENCTVNGAIIPLGGNTLNLSDVTITNNVTTAGAITVGESGKLKVSGEVIVTGNTAGGVAKNVVPTDATNLELAGLLDTNAKIGVSFGGKGVAFGVNAIADEVTPAELKTSAAKFFNDAAPRKFKGRVNGEHQLYWMTKGMIFIMK